MQSPHPAPAAEDHPDLQTLREKRLARFDPRVAAAPLLPPSLPPPPPPQVHGSSCSNMAQPDLAQMTAASMARRAYGNALKRRCGDMELELELERGAVKVARV